MRLNYPVSSSSLGKLNAFPSVNVTDSTQVSLPQSLLGDFKGANDNAQLKLHVTLEYLSGQWVGLEVTDGKASDQNSELVHTHAQAGSLNLFDLGYFKQERLRDVDEQDAYFVSRCQSQTALYDCESHKRINVVDWLKSLKTKQGERMVLLGSRVRLPVRLIVKKLAPSKADVRRRQSIDQYGRNGKTCSEKYLFLLGWDILITNLPASDWDIKSVLALYPIRLQIEWLFRTWKSLLQVNHFGNWRLERVLCQLYAHLIGILICHRLSAGWLMRDGTEFSFYKCVQVLKDHIDKLVYSVGRNWYGIRQWLARVEDDFKDFARKTKRKKSPSTAYSLTIEGLS